jgi:TM2 domain-containing membrane protein YozV
MASMAFIILISSICFLISSLILILITLIIYKKKNKKIQNSLTNSKIQRGLLFYSLITLLGHIFCATISVIKYKK